MRGWATWSTSGLTWSVGLRSDLRRFSFWLSTVTEAGNEFGTTSPYGAALIRVGQTEKKWVSLVHSHWSRNVQLLHYCDLIGRELPQWCWRQQSYAIKNQLGHPKAPTTLLAPRWWSSLSFALSVHFHFHEWLPTFTSKPADISYFAGRKISAVSRARKSLKYFPPMFAGSEMTISPWF